MKSLRSLFLLFFLAGILTACSGASSGPRAWIDQPLDGSEFPLQPVTLTAHAADDDGISSFEVYLNAELLQTLSAGGERLGEASWEWLPPEPGEYTIQVVAIDSQGNRGSQAESQVTISGVALDPAQAPLQETLQASIDQIECLSDQTVAVSFSIISPLGIESYGIWSTWVDVEHSETFQDPLPTNISKTVNITEPVQDQIDRNHQWGLKVVLAGQADPYFFYALEPDGRCPGHYLNTTLKDTPSALIDLITAGQNLVCRFGPDGLFEAVAYLTPGQTARAVGKLANSTWIQVEVPDRSQPCWIAANLVEIPPGLLDTLPDVAPPPLPTLAPTDAPAADTTAPSISGLSSTPDLILTQSGGCSLYSRTTTVQASITDDTSVSQVTASWTIGGESGQVTLSHAGGSTYQGQIGPLSTTGTLSITVQAVDSTGNTSSASAPSVTVQNCIE